MRCDIWWNVIEQSSGVGSHREWMGVMTCLVWASSQCPLAGMELTIMAPMDRNMIQRVALGFRLTNLWEFSETSSFSQDKYSQRLHGDPLMLFRSCNEYYFPPGGISCPPNRQIIISLLTPQRFILFVALSKHTQNWAEELLLCFNVAAKLKRKKKSSPSFNSFRKHLILSIY